MTKPVIKNLKKRNTLKNVKLKKGVSAGHNTLKTVKVRAQRVAVSESLRYGEVRPEVRELVKQRLAKHASTWTELAKR